MTHNPREKDTSPQGATSDAELDSWWATYLRQVDLGESVDRAALLAKCPIEIREALGELMQISEQVDDMAGPPVGTHPPDSMEHDSPQPLDPTRAYLPTVPPEALTRLASPTVTHVERPTLSASEKVAAEPRLGEQFGDYELLEVLGRGGMGVVYRARQVSLNRIVAVKMILAGRLATDEDIRRFEAEAQAAARIDHPHIVTIYQIGEVDGRQFFSMDYIDGPNLAEVCRKEPLESGRAAAYLRTVAEAVHAAHEQGVLHRDLKPANILIDRDDSPCVTDFGLAKHLEGDSGLTATGVAIGTPSYMPPEQASGQWQRVGPASDVYSLGAILYVMLTGRPPFRADSMVATLLSVVHQEPTRPRQIEPKADPVLETICLKCLRKDPADRYQTAQDLADDLGRYLRDEPILAHPLGPWKRTLTWVRDIPLIAALTGRPVAHPLPGHYRAQAALILAAMVFVVLAVLTFRVSRMPSGRLPPTIQIAAGREGGMYSEFSRQLAEELEPLLERPVEAVPTTGSADNRQLLRDGTVHLALMQAGLLHGDEVRVVAPVFHEVVHVIARSDRSCRRIFDLQGRAVCLGEPGSGSRITGEAVLRYYGLETQRDSRDGDWKRFLGDPRMDAAIVTVGLGNRFLVDALSGGDFRLLPVSWSGDWGDRTLEPCHIGQDRYPAAIDDPEGLSTVRTPAFLVTQPTAPDRLVWASLEALYRLEGVDRISRATATSWSFLPWHRAAREFLESAP
jgi:eukaryotic-like serine/threonine-protein kinase